MRHFARLPCPDWWLELDHEWRALSPASMPGDPLGKKHEGRVLRQWFHELSLPPEAPRLCAWCDGLVAVTSRGVIDHVVPRARCPELALCWDNLVLSCDFCNSTYKSTHWSSLLVRPDHDAEHRRLLSCDPATGKVSPAVELDASWRCRVEYTIRRLGLNAGERPRARRDHFKLLSGLLKPPVQEQDLALYRREGPYRFLADELLEALALSVLLTSG